MKVSFTKFVSLFVSLLALFSKNCNVEAVRRKCLDKSGSYQCTEGEVCVKGRSTPCDPPDMHRKCRCKNNFVRGCVNRIGQSQCSEGEVCVKGRSTPCDPPNLHRKKCRCKNNFVRGCVDRLGQSVCTKEETCLLKKSNEACANPKSRKCTCKIVEMKEGCQVNTAEGFAYIPYDVRNWELKGSCMVCSCLNWGMGYYSECRSKPGCVSFFLFGRK